jgi:hypothetical protein
VCDWLYIFNLILTLYIDQFGWRVSSGLCVTEFWSLMSCSLIQFFVKPHTLSITDDSNFHSHRDDRVKAHGKLVAIAYDCNRSVLVDITIKLRYIRPGV